MKRSACAVLFAAVSVVVLFADYSFVSAPTVVTTDLTPFHITNVPTADDLHLIAVVKLGVQSAATIISDQSDTYETPNNVLALGSSLNTWVACDAVGGSTEHEITDAGATASVIVAPVFRGTTNSGCIDDAPTGASNASITGAPFTGVTITATGPALMIGCLATTAVPTVTSSGAVSETNMSGNDGTIFLNCAHRRASGAGTYAFTWTFAGSQATFDIGYAISETGGGASSFIPAIINQPVGRGGGVRAR